jgi:hypothetical protein
VREKIEKMLDTVGVNSASHVNDKVDIPVVCPRISDYFPQTIMPDDKKSVVRH